MRAALLLSSLLLTACWSPRYFTPREHVNGSGPGGQPAAVYSVAAADNTRPACGEVRIWSNGARARYDEQQDEVVELVVGFELENIGAELLQLDLASVQCEDLMVGGLLQAPLAPIRVDGDGSAVPGTTARVELVFQPPADAPRHVESFAIRFTVNGVGRQALTQVTPFGPRISPAMSPYYRGAYSPYWGYGWGGYGYAYYGGFGGTGHHGHHR